MQIGPALVAEISPTRKRAGLVDRAGNEVFLSCTRLGRAICCDPLKEGWLPKDNCIRWRAFSFNAQLTVQGSQGWELGRERSFLV